MTVSEFVDAMASAKFVVIRARAVYFEICPNRQQRHKASSQKQRQKQKLNVKERKLRQGGGDSETHLCVSVKKGFPEKGGLHSLNLKFHPIG